MKRHLTTFFTSVLILTFAFLPLSSFAQGNLPTEKVLVHTDKPFYVTGETIWFKANCLDLTQPKMQSLSKVLYVELINKDGDPVRQVKVRLEDGKGSGQILVTPDIITDKFELRAYTSWMKNFGEETFSSQELSIINPSVPPVYEASELATNSPASSRALKSKSSGVVSIPKKAYGEKEEVKVSLNPTISGNLSMSVYKYNEQLEEASRSPQKQLSVSPKGNVEVVYPPEIRAPLVSGKITSADSIPENLYTIFTGTESDMSFLSVSDAGDFIFEVSPKQVNKELLFWSNTMPLDPDGISINSPFLPAEEREMELKLDTTVQAFLEDNLFNIQASHAYDTISNIKGTGSTVEPKLYFYGTPDASYLLDDFTRFKTIKETLVEYVREAYLKKKRITLYYERSNGAFDGPALVLLDGVPVKEDSLILDFNPKKVKSIEIITDYYVVGKEIFKGVINFITFDKDYGNIPSSYLVEKPYQELLQARSFYAPMHGASEASRLPDFRNTLHWEPNIELSKGKTEEISFFTSLSTGSYKVELAGVTSDGRPFLEEAFFEVVKSSK